MGVYLRMLAGVQFVGTLAPAGAAEVELKIELAASKILGIPRHPCKQNSERKHAAV